MKKEFSAGGIVFNNKREVLITQHSSNKYWSFPKGNPNQGESMKETALREVREEGGVAAEIIGRVGQVNYIYTDPRDQEKTFKIATYYLMRYLSGNPQNHDWEVSQAKWVGFEEALKTLSFKNDQEMLEKAYEKFCFPGRDQTSGSH